MLQLMEWERRSTNNVIDVSFDEMCKWTYILLADEMCKWTYIMLADEMWSGTT